MKKLLVVDSQGIEVSVPCEVVRTAAEAVAKAAGISPIVIPDDGVLAVFDGERQCLLFSVEIVSDSWSSEHLKEEFRTPVNGRFPEESVYCCGDLAWHEITTYCFALDSGTVSRL